MSISLLIYNSGELRGSFQLEVVFYRGFARRAISKLCLVQYAIDRRSLRELNRSHFTIPVDLYA
jgi:hypothetical protein